MLMNEKSSLIPLLKHFTFERHNEEHVYIAQQKSADQNAQLLCCDIPIQYHLVCSFKRLTNLYSCVDLSHFSCDDLTIS